MALGRAVAGGGTRRSIPTPLRRGAAVVAVTGGAFSLVGAAPAIDVDAAAGLDGTAAGAATVMQVARTAPVELPVQRPAVELVAYRPDVADAGELVKAVQLAEQAVARAAAEQQAATERAAAEQVAAEQEAARRKAAAEKARQQAEQRSAPATGAPDCGLDTSGLGSIKSHVRAAAGFLGCLFGEPPMIGVAGRSGASDHPSGRALDFMVDRATGDALADCALRNKETLGISYVIWRQRINHGSGWKPMEDRGGATANHMDHVHVSFGSAAANGRPGGC